MDANPVETPRVVSNGGAIPLARLPVLDTAGFRRHVIDAVRDGARVAALFGVSAPPMRSVDARGEPVRLYAVLAHPDRGRLAVVVTEAIGGYASLTPECPGFHLFEREILEQCGLRPEGHPWLKPVRREAGAGPFFRVQGEEIHEVGVGPVHAGIIEPGHFRFQCHGERVLHLEIALGYQHRGVERAMRAGASPVAPEPQPGHRTLHWMETVAGDTSVGHATACCAALEALAGRKPPLRGQAIRAVALELERLANHTGDLAALANDVGFLPTASYCGRLRGDFLNLSATICGSRFGRGLVRPGGVRFDIDADRAAAMLSRLATARRDVGLAAEQFFSRPSVLARLEGTGTVDRKTALDLGLVGPAARACGLERDARQDFPAGLYRYAHIPVSTWHTGDVYARAQVRRLEMQRSMDFVRDHLAALPDGPPREEPPAPVRPGAIPPLAPDALAVSLVEGWRGEICHVAITDGQGRIAAYKVVDPSFHNWTGLAMALRDQPISDFPLCNKSFNLSYCGFDL